MARSVVGKDRTDRRRRGGPGGGTGIGKAFAEAFARDGRRVVIVGRREGVVHAAAEEIGAGVVPLAADLADVAQVERARRRSGRRC
jgi:3-oxoacyl-[acyl-carrier protein] reductase